MFTQKCFIRKNSKELQDKVYRLGHRDGTHLWECTFNTLLIANEEYFRCYDDEWGNADSLIRKGYIDCGTNEELFLAIAALRDDSDYMQYFVSDNDPEMFLLCCYKEFHCFGIDPDNAFNYCDYKDEFHKATVEELIEHFKK